MTYIFLTLIAVILAYGYATGQNPVTVATSDEPSSAPPQNTTNQTGIAMYQSDGSLTGDTITADPASWPGSDKIWNICTAVAMAEGYNQGSGVAPFDLNNPGDLSPGDENGQPTCGGAQYHSGSYIIVFCTAEAGWQALYAKFSNIVNGRSSVYPKTLTWAQVAQKYAGNASNWLANVTNYLGVSPSSTPAQYVNS